jgi:hypothetical protein
MLSLSKIEEEILVFHEVVQVAPTVDYKVYIYFADGKIKLFDAKELVTKGVFKQLQDINIFIDTCTVLNNTLAWDITGKQDPENCLDLDPEMLYDSCPEVKESDMRELRS